MAAPAFFSKVISLYVDGFRNMTVGRSLWLLIIIKLFIFFAVLKFFFFPDILGTSYDNDADRATAVRTALSADNTMTDKQP